MIARFGRAIVVLLLAATASLPSAAAGQQPDGPTITFVRQTAEVDPDGRFTVVFDVDDAPAGGSYVVDIDDRIVTRADLDPPATGLGGWRATFDPVPLPDDDDDPRIDLALHLYDRGEPRPADAGQWAYQLTEPGVYPVRIRVRDADGNDVAAAVTYLVRRPSPDVEAPTADVALLLALTPAAPNQKVLDEEAVRGLLDVLADHPDVPLTVVIDPDLLDATAATEGGRVLVDDLADLVAREQVELLGAPFSDLDAAALAANGLADTIAEQARLGAVTYQQRLDQAATPTWWQPRPLDPVAAVALRSVGVEHLVVPPSSLIGTTPLVPTPLVGLDPSFTVVAAATDLGTVSGPDGDPVLASRRWFGTVAADATLAGGSGSATVALIDPSTADPDTVDRVLDLLDAEIDTVEAVNVSDLFSRTPPAPTPMALAEPPPVDLGAYVDARNRVLGVANSYATMRIDPEAIDDGRARAIARSERAGLNTDERVAMLDDVERDLRSAYAAITTRDDRITLGARNATIPLPIESSADEPLRVRIRLTSSNRLEFPRNDFEVIVEPGRTTVSVPVRVRTSGDIPMQVLVTTPDGAIVLAESRYSVRSTAVSGVGIVLTAGAAGFLALWWGRHIWRSRRDRADADVTDPSVHGSDSV